MTKTEPTKQAVDELTPKYVDITWDCGSGTSADSSVSHGLGRKPIILSAQITSYSSNGSYLVIPTATYYSASNFSSFSLMSTDTQISLSVYRASSLVSGGWYTSGTVRVYYI